MAVYQRGKNWYIDFTFHGHRVREMIGSRKVAKAVIAKRRGEIAENKFLDVRKDPEPVKFYDFAKRYLQWARANKKPSSYKRDLSRMRMLDREFGTMDIRKITAQKLEEYATKRATKVRRPGGVIGCLGGNGTGSEMWFVDYHNSRGRKVRKTFTSKKGAEAYLDRIQRPMKPASVNREMAVIRHMLSKAFDWGIIQENPAKRVKMLKGEVKRLRYLMPDEFQRLLSNCPDDLKPIVTVASHTGLRKGELLGLQWDQVNFEKGIISILDTKNGERRDIPMNETVRAALNGIQRNGDHVFCHEDNKLRRSFDAVVKNSGIEDFRFHDLRHTFASNLVMEGVDIMAVKELLGHKKLDMTLRYAHLAPNYKTKAVNVLDRVMSGASEPIKQAIPLTLMSLIPPHQGGESMGVATTH